MVSLLIEDGDVPIKQGGGIACFYLPSKYCEEHLRYVIGYTLYRKPLLVHVLQRNSVTFRHKKGGCLYDRISSYTCSCFCCHSCYLESACETCQRRCASDLLVRYTLDGNLCTSSSAVCIACSYTSDSAGFALHSREWLIGVRLFSTTPTRL